MDQNNKNAAKNAKAAARVRAVQQQKKQRMQWSIGIIVLVIAGIAVLVLAKSSKDSSKTAASDQTAKPAPASVVSDLAAVPLDAIAAATKAAPSSNPVAPIPNGKLRIKNGKPQVLYIGAEFCPYCAGERWALVSALSKFGTFSNLKVIHSSESDVPTLTFEGSSYTSDYVTFTGLEMLDQNHNPLDTVSAADQKLFSDTTLRGAQSANSFPFIDFGGKFMQNGGSVEVRYLVGKTHADIAKALAGSTVKDSSATSMLGNVNGVTGGFIDAICKLTDDKPAKVCKAIASS